MASDAVAIAGYRVFEDRQPVQEIGAATLMTHVPSIVPNLPHTFRVQAFDAAGAVSTDGLSTTALIDGRD